MKNVNIEVIIMAVATSFNVSPIDIVKGTLGDKQLMYARDVCAYLLSGKMPRCKIPALLGRSSFSYYYEALKKVRAKCVEDQHFQRRVMKLAYRFN